MKKGIFAAKHNREHEIVIETPARALPARPLTRALLIGINYTGTSSQLNGCINDVNHIYRWLTETQGYDASQIRVLTDERHVPEQFRPTRANILSSFEWLHEIVRAEPEPEQRRPTKMFVHYSGHGSWQPDRNGDELDGRDESICPLDYARSGVITDDELRARLVDPIRDNPSVQLTCIFDSCHSGTVLDMRIECKVSVNSMVPDRRGFQIIQNKKQPRTKADVVVFSGSMDKQTSADAWINNKAQGAMTWGFLSVVRSLQAKGKPITLKRLLAHLQILLKREGYSQVPQLSLGQFKPLNSTIDP